MVDPRGAGLMPYDFGRGDTALERIARAREEATDEYRDAIDAEAEAHNAFLLVFSEAILKLRDEGTAATSLTQIAKAMCLKEENRWNLAKAAKQRCWNKVDELGDRLMAAQSYFKVIREQT